MKTPHFSPGFFVLLLSVSTFAVQSRAETGYEGWLRYEKIDDASIKRNDDESLPAAVVPSSGSEFTQSAQSHLVCVGRNAGRTFRNHTSVALAHSVKLFAGSNSKLRNRSRTGLLIWYPGCSARLGGLFPPRPAGFASGNFPV
jgi:hypothetical protein